MIGLAFTSPEKWILKGIPILFIIGTVLHFTYGLLWKNPLVGLVSPVNESVWEHCKLVVWPIILWWSLYYIGPGKTENIQPDAWFTGALAALLTALLAIPLIFYFYTQAFGVELLWVDIALLFGSLVLGQLMGLHVYRHGSGLSAALVLIIFAAIALMFMIFTFFPPKIPLFRDSSTGLYGTKHT